jgi:hypothetical protein
MISLEHRGVEDLAALSEAPEKDRAVLAERVRILRLRGNALRGIGDNALLNLERLTDVDLSANRIEALDGALPAGLTRLDVSSNRLSSLGVALSACVALRYLDIADNRITSLRGLPSIAAQESRSDGGADATDELFTLKARGNMITSCRRIRQSIGARLGECDLRGNKVEAADDVADLADASPRLRRLLIADNPCAFGGASSRLASMLRVMRPACKFDVDAPTSARDSSTARRLYSPPRDAREGPANGVDQLQATAAPPSSDLVMHLGQLDATAATLRAVMQDLSNEREANAELQRQLKVAKRRGDDFAAAARARGEELASLREDAHALAEQNHALQRKVADMRRRVGDDDMPRRATSRAERMQRGASVGKRRGSPAQQRQGRTLPGPSAVGGASLASTMIRELSPIHGGDDADAPSAVRMPPPPPPPLSPGFSSSASSPDPLLTRQAERVAQLDAALAERDAYIETLSAENESLAATAQRLLSDRIAQSTRASAAAAANAGRTRPTEPLASPAR